MAVPSAMVRSIMVVVLYSFLNKIGSFAILAAILLASSFVSKFAATRRPGSSSK
jgi:hypothetical protein